MQTARAATVAAREAEEKRRREEDVTGEERRERETYDQTAPDKNIGASSCDFFLSCSVQCSSEDSRGRARRWLAYLNSASPRVPSKISLWGH